MLWWRAELPLHHEQPAADRPAQSFPCSVFLLDSNSAFTPTKTGIVGSCPWLNSPLEKGLWSNPGVLLSRCRLCCAGAGLTHANCVMSPALQTFPNMPFASRPPVQPCFPTTGETLGRSPTWGEHGGSSSCSGFESPWQMFAIPAPSLISETKPLIIPDQSPPVLIDSQCVFHTTLCCSGHSLTSLVLINKSSF